MKYFVCEFTVSKVDTRPYFTTVTIIIAVLIQGKHLNSHPPTVWALGFIFIFTIGGITGVILANSSINIIV